MLHGRKWALGATVAVLGVLSPGAATATSHLTGPPAAPHTSQVTGRLSSMSCATHSVCFAISSAHKLTRWGVIRLTHKGATSTTRLVARNLTLLALSCPSAAGCDALTERDSDFTFEVLPVGIHGTIGPPRTLGAHSPIPLSDIACHPTRTHCTLVGAAGRTIRVVTVNGANTVSHDSSLAKTVSGVSFAAVACPTTRQCYAAGVADIHGKAHGLVVPITNGIPGRPTYLASASAVGLLGIACTSGKRCYAIGFGHRSFVYTLASAKLVHSAKAPRAVVLFGIACRSVHTCDAVGSRTAVRGVVLPVHNGRLGKVQITSVTPSYGSTAADGEQGPIAGFHGGIEIAGVDRSKRFHTVISGS